MSYPIKKTPNDFPVHDLLLKRWSPVIFTDTPIEHEKLMSLFEALRWAPSSFNEQPWRVVYATKDTPEEFEKLASLLAEGNAWAKNAYMLMVICAVPNFSRNQKPNVNYAYDTGAALENLFLQAVSMDLVAHEMAGFDHEAPHELLEVPKDVEVLAMMAVGYPGEAGSATPEQVERDKAPRVRKNREEVIFRGKWKSE
jgi:nitroreductase